MRLSGVRFRFSLALVAGALYPLSFAPLNLAPLAPLSLAILFFVWRCASAREAGVLGFVFGLATFAVGISWVYVSLHQYGNMPAPLAAVAVIIFAGLMAVYPALAGWGQACFRPLSPAMRCITVMPALWVAGEWLRGTLLSGFPWLYLGYSQVDTPLASLLPLVGALGVSLWGALAGGALLLVVMQKGRERTGALAVLAVLAIGVALSRIPVFVQAVGEPIEVAVIQNNISLKDKWQSGQAHVIATRYFEASRPLSGVDLIVWPEGALPAYLDQISAGFLNALHQHPSDFLIGLLERSDRVAGSDYYNAALGIGEQTSLYRKHQLVPFGEYLPLAPLLGWLLDYLKIPMSDFSAGPGQQAPLPLAGQQIGVSICYEDAFSTRINTALPDATVLANLSEDAWFGDSLAPHQRLQMARARALETGRPMIRSSNNGLSSLIGPDGVVNALAPQFETAVVRGTVQPMTGLTPAVRYGNLPAGLGCLFLLGIGLWRRKAAGGHA